MLPLKTTLFVNGISSGVTGVLLAVFSKPVAGIFNVANTSIFAATGIFLVLFAAFVVLTAANKTTNTSAVKLISTLDVLWVIGSAVTVLYFLTAISTIGIVLIIAVAGWVAMMAWLQTRGLKKVRG